MLSPQQWSIQLMMQACGVPHSIVRVRCSHGESIKGEFGLSVLKRAKTRSEVHCISTCVYEIQAEKAGVAWSESAQANVRMSISLLFGQRLPLLDVYQYLPV